MARKGGKDRGLYRDGKGRWCIEYYDQFGRRHREVVGFCKTEAKAAYQRRKDQVRSQRFYPEMVSHRDTLFEEMAKAYMEYSKTNKPPKSQREDGYMMRGLLEEFSGKALAQITPQDVEKLKAKMVAKGLAPATINRRMALLKAMLNRAIEWGMTKDNPMKRVKMLRVNNQRVRYLTEDEETALMKEIPEGYRPIIIVALNTGLRRGELFNLRWPDVNFTTWVITIPRSKHGEARHVPMNQVVRETLILTTS